MATDVNTRRNKSTNNSNKKNIDKNTDRLTIIMVLILSVFLLGIILYTTTGGISLGNIQFMTTTVTQSKVKEDGSPKTVTATYNVEVDTTHVSKAEVEAVLYETMDSFSYEELTGDNAMENLKDSAMNNLQAKYGGENVLNIYVSDYNTDAANAPDGVATQTNDQRNSVMKGLFQGMD